MLHNFSIEVDASDKADLDEEKVVARLRAVSYTFHSHFLESIICSLGRRCILRWRGSIEFTSKPSVFAFIFLGE